MGLTEEKPICRLCNEEEETASQIIFEHKALVNLRFQTMGSTNTQDEFPKEKLIARILELSEKSALLD